MSNLEKHINQTRFLRDCYNQVNLAATYYDPNPKSKICNNLRKWGINKKESSFNALNEGVFRYFARYYACEEAIDIRLSEGSSSIILSKDMKKVIAESLKIVISLSMESGHLTDATKIVDFMNENNIANIMRVSRYVTTSNVNIFLSNMEDVKKITDFISSDKEIQTILNFPNPFSHVFNKISYSFDFGIPGCDYSSVLCSYITYYLQEKAFTGKFNDVFASDFNLFMAEKVQLFNQSAFSKKQFEITFNKDLIPEVELYKLKQLTELIQSSSRVDFDFEKLEYLYKKYKTLQNKSIFDIFEIDDIIKSIISYDDLSAFDEKRIEMLKQYLINGNINVLNVSDEIKTKMEETDFYNVLNYLLVDNNQSLDDYIRDIMACDLINNNLLLEYEKNGRYYSFEDCIKQIARQMTNKRVSTSQRVREKLYNNVSIMNSKIRIPSLYETREEQIFGIIYEYSISYLHYIKSKRKKQEQIKKTKKKNKKNV